MAVVVPHPHKIVDSKVLVLGCALEVTVIARGTDQGVAFISVYLPPDSRGDVLGALQAVTCRVAREVYAGGDVKLADALAPG